MPSPRIISTGYPPFVGGFIAGDQLFFMTTYYMYFPFLTCQAVGPDEPLAVADRQNAYSMTAAVRAVAELFCAVNREDEINRKVLGLSISHNDMEVRICGHHPVITGKGIKYYEYPIHHFSITSLDERDKWTTYRFMKNVYDMWMPAHFTSIYSAIDQLPSELDVDDVPPLSEASEVLPSRMQPGCCTQAGSLPRMYCERAGKPVESRGGVSGLLWTSHPQGGTAGS